MQKRWKKCKNIFFGLKQISKCDTCFYNHSQGLFKNIVFRSVALVKNSYGLFKFFLYTPVFYRAVPSLPYG